MSSTQSYTLKKLDQVSVASSEVAVDFDATPESESKPEPPSPPSFPDGGREAWAVVTGAWLAVFVSFGFLNAFGTYYKENQLSHKSESDIAWIGAFQTFCIYFMGSVFGSIFDKYGAGPLLFIGGIGFSLSCMMQSICKEFWQFFLAQGLLQGLCLSALFSPSFASVNHWFFKRRGLALGIVTSGSSVGGVIWPIAINRLIGEVGFGWALRTCGFIALVLTTIAAFMVKGRLPKRTGSEFFAFGLFRSPAYTTFCSIVQLATHLTYIGIFFLLFFLPSYGAANGFDSNMIFYSVSVLNAASFFGRILPGMAADSWGRYNIMIITGFISALLAFVSIATRNTASILVVGALYGFTSGNVLSLQGACVPPLLDDPRKIGIGIGQMLSVSAFGALLGPPISGWLIASSGFKSAQIFSGVMLAFGSILLCVTRSLLPMKDSKWIA
ncbi:major facilitator superfamily domain-containing protein [Lentinula detonsa]|uniref:Major facilitator superfamily domain-containing protein n=1 Tax=Lentinula detonsa TaxID=2804962 RepID=A0A9W8TZ46_9AGAR|nr:major facilitator superfamily domain-containing protein [Lentinula detonsa]